MTNTDAPPAAPQGQAPSGQAPPVAQMGPGVPVGPLCARKPFDNHSGGDCCLFTPDGVVFFVHRNILSLASPIFAHMITNTPLMVGGYTPIFISVYESSDVLDALLRCIYPIRRRPLNDVNFAVALTLSAQRYCISPRLLPLHSFLLRDRAALLSQPATVYALSWKLGYEDAALAASRHAVLADLTNCQVKTRITQCAGDCEALVALCVLKQKREEHIQKIVCAIPLEDMLMACNERKKDKNHFKKLADVVKKAFSIPDPREEDLKIRAIFSQVCDDCCCRTDSMVVAAFDAYYEAVKSFPQTIEWPRDKPSLFPPDEE